MENNYSYFANEKGDYTIAFKESDYTDEKLLAICQDEEYAVLICKALNVITSCSCLFKLKDNEPFFVLRGQDKSAVPTIFEWLQLNPSLKDGKLNDTISLIQEFKEYPFKKSAD